MLHAATEATLNGNMQIWRAKPYLKPNKTCLETLSFNHLKSVVTDTTKPQINSERKEVSPVKFILASKKQGWLVTDTLCVQ